jgi:hypothetical protein
LESGPGPKAVLRDGGGARRLRTVNTLSRHFAIDETNAYVTERGRGVVLSCARHTGCGDAGVVLSLTENEPLGIAVDDKAIYWANHGNGDAGRIMRLAK